MYNLAPGGCEIALADNFDIPLIPMNHSIYDYVTGNKLIFLTTRPLCVLPNTKLYNQNLLVLISTKFAFWMAKKHFSHQFKTISDLITFLAPLWTFFSQDQPICLNSHEKLTKIEVMSCWESVRTLLRITHLAHRKSYLIIICPNSHKKLINSKIR